MVFCVDTDGDYLSIVLTLTSTALLKTCSPLVGSHRFEKYTQPWIYQMLFSIFLAAAIHETDFGVRKAARNVLKQLPRSKTDVIYRVVNSRSPLHFVLASCS